MAKTLVFVRFDVDHDNDCRHRFVCQAAEEGSPFEVTDWSIREVAKDWAAKARKRIYNVDQLVAICGENTHTANGVSAEIMLDREVGRPYVLVDRRQGRARRPAAAFGTDDMYEWSRVLARPELPRSD